MINKIRFDGDAGEAAKFLARSKAVKRLALSLPDFRRLCILKGVYPREPKSRKKAQKGSSALNLLYLRKDVAFMSHEPITWKFRSEKTHKKKLKNAHGRGDKEKLQRLLDNKPIYRLDHIVRERYPTFTDALRDMDDPLCLSFLFATLPKTMCKDSELVKLCRRLTIEFMHYVIEAKALRKVFISFKGYYYEVEIMGQPIRWISPHPFIPVSDYKVNFDVMSTFCEFYITLLGFVNYRLYHQLGLYYPPVLAFPKSENTKSDVKGDKDDDDEELRISERVAALNSPIYRSTREEEETSIDTHLMATENEDALVNSRKEQEEIEKLQNLFKGFKFFIGRENNRESLTFVIRACSGEVSWDSRDFPGAIFNEDDQSVTHQIVDRPRVDKKFLSRFYIQPQWVYDTINARKLLPVQSYFPGVDLPPHVSPFVILDNENLYVPPEHQKILPLYEKQQREEKKDEFSVAEKEENLEEEIKNRKKELSKLSKKRRKEINRRQKRAEQQKEKDEVTKKKEDRARERREREENRKIVKEPNGEDPGDIYSSEDEEQKIIETSDPLSKMAVAKGKVMKRNEKLEMLREEKDELRRRAMMIPKKRRHVYSQLVKRENALHRRKDILQKKRAKHDEEIKFGKIIKE